jgi:hypothetical protein
MNNEKTKLFAELVNRQFANDSTAIKDLNRIDVSLKDGYCLYNLYEQWEGAFSFSPGVIAVLPLIASLAKKICLYKNDDTLKMYSESEWGEIVLHRGPFECAIRYTCKKCRGEYIGFGQSGFDDRYPSVCDSCGDVWLQSGYDETPLPTCNCGGSYCSFGCPKCKSREIRESEYFSSYEYFINHKLKEKGQQIAP